MKINSNDFRVRPGAKVKLKNWPTNVKPFCKSKRRYKEALEAHVEALSALQQLHYASHRYALLLIFQGMDDRDQHSRSSLVCRPSRRQGECPVNCFPNYP